MSDLKGLPLVHHCPFTIAHPHVVSSRLPSTSILAGLHPSIKKQWPSSRFSHANERVFSVSFRSLSVLLPKAVQVRAALDHDA